MKFTFLKKHKKKLFIVSSVCILFVLVVILFISPISKYLIEKYDEKITGRQITMDWAYVNPFTGYIHFSNLNIYEYKKDTVFISFEGVSLDIAVSKLLFGTYEISEIRLNRPKGIVIREEQRFNFTDLIEKFSKKNNKDTTASPLHLNILGVVVEDGEFSYLERLTPVNYTILKVNIASSGIRWNADTTDAEFSFKSDTGTGTVRGKVSMNLKNLDYRFSAIVRKFDLKLIAQYMDDLSNFGSFAASLDADIKATGNFLDQEDIDASGMIAINELHLGKNINEDYLAFSRLKVAVLRLSPKKNKYLFDTIALEKPYFKYERYDKLDNLQAMFGKDGANISSVNANPAKFNLVIEIGKYMEVLAKNFFRSNYKINLLSVSDGNLRFNDFSIIEKFSIGLYPLNIYADSIDKNRKRAEMSFNSQIKPYGDASVRLSINPKDSSDFDLYYNLKNMPVSIFNPYMVTLTSFPLDRGTVEFNGSCHVRDGHVKSNNHLLVIDPRASGRIRNKDMKWIPVPLLFAFIREKGNVIDYEIPISGNMNSPEFHIRDVIFDLLENIFIKPTSIPYRMTVKNMESEIEKSLTIKWAMRENALTRSQEKFVSKMVEFLESNPDASISVYPQFYDEKEKECILFFEAKKKYFLSTHSGGSASFSESDSLFVNKMSIKDSLFIRYLNKHVEGELLFTVQDKCARLLSNAFVNNKFNRLNEQRAASFISPFKEKQLMKQIKMHKGEKVIPYNGFTFYKIAYKGEMPDYLKDAYNQMNELNDESPRKRFKRERKTIKN